MTHVIYYLSDIYCLPATYPESSSPSAFQALLAQPAQYERVLTTKTLSLGPLRQVPQTRFPPPPCASDGASCCRYLSDVMKARWENDLRIAYCVSGETNLGLGVEAEFEG